MSDTPQDMKIRITADEMIAQFGDQRAALEAGEWANAARHRGDIASYEFWQWVTMDINDRNMKKWRPRKAEIKGRDA